MLRRVRFATWVTVAVLALVPAVGASVAPRPRITFVSPMRVKVGASLTIRGEHLRRGRLANTVIFRARNGRVVFAKARRGSDRKIVVIVPPAVDQLAPEGGTRASSFRLRILSGRRLGKYTPRRLSPVIVPSTMRTR